MEDVATVDPLVRIDRAISGWEFEALPLARGGHLQTIFGSLWRRSYSPAVIDAEVRLVEIEPGTQVLLRCSWQPDRTAAPTALIVHGLEGSDASCYMLGTADKAFAAGWNAVRMNLRNCGGTEHLTPTLYNSGMSGDVLSVVRYLAGECGLGPIALVGFSLGGNLVLKMAGELGERAMDDAHRLLGVMAVSPAVDLSAAAACLELPSNILYQKRFVRSLHKRLREKDRHFPGHYDLSLLAKCPRIREYDTHYIAPLFGFRDAEDYYERASARQVLASIAVPALLLHADDDPFIPLTKRVHEASAANSNIRIRTVSTGGHVGFVGRGGVSSRDGEDRHWAENRCIEFLNLLRYDHARSPG